MTGSGRVALMVGMLGLGCASSAMDGTPRLELTGAEMVLEFGVLEGDSGSVAVFSDIVDAAVSETGRYIAAVDRAPPFIHLLDRSGGNGLNFGMRGGGPGELRGALSVDFLGDTALVVLTSGRMEIFRTDGTWLWGRGLSEHRLMGMSATLACTNQIVLYGIPVERHGMSEVPWLHAWDLSANTDPRPVLSIPGSAEGLARWGGLIGLDGTSKGVWLWHVDFIAGTETGYWRPCGRSKAVVVDEAGVGPVNARQHDVNGQRGTSFVLPDTLFAGAAAGDSSLVRAFGWRDGENWVTTVRIVAQEWCGEVELAGSWTLHDLSAGVLVFEESEIFPRIVGVSWEWLAKQARSVECKGRRSIHEPNGV